MTLFYLAGLSQRKVARAVLDAVGRPASQDPAPATVSARGIVDELLARLGSAQPAAVRRRT